MRITVIAKPGAKEAKIEQCKIASSPTPRNDGQMRCLVVSVKEPAKEGRANWAIERALAAHFGVSPSRVRIVSGQTARTKVVEIL